MKNIKHNRENISFNTSGKLVFCLIEFRPMEEIEYVINSILKVYHPSEIGLTIVFGNLNKDLVYKITESMSNVNYVHYNFDNINIKTYNKILKWHNFYKNFESWKHVLIIQTDALLLRKIDDVYFNFDYIGAPWKNPKNATYTGR